MKRPILPFVVIALALLATPLETVLACTNVLVSRGASKDGSVYITYSADAPFMPRLLLVPGATHAPGAKAKVWGWEDDTVRGHVAQVSKTHGVVGLINRYQVSIAETTTGGLEELHDPKGLLDYDALMLLTLQRAKSAREAIAIMDALCQEYGYGSEGETFSIADKNEVWMMELIGKGPKEKGAVWVAARVPDGYVTAHANLSRITTFPLDDPENWLYAKDVVSFATKRGYYDPAKGKPFSWRDAYHSNIDEIGRRACAGRVWSVYRRVAPSQNFSDDYFRNVPGAEDYPLFVKPDEKLSTGDVMALMRDHYEGTPYDQTQGVAAGPFGSPYRFRGLRWEFEGKKYLWERSISTQQAGFVMVAQSRNWLPDPVGGVYWFTPDDCYTSAFTPLYCGITDLPKPYTVGDHNRFSWDSAWWMFNLVSNLTYDRWSRILPDVQQAQRAHEQKHMKLLGLTDLTAKRLFEEDPTYVSEYLTNYSVSTAEGLFRKWQKLAGDIITKHNDGYVNPRDGSEPKGVGYSKAWLRRVLAEQAEQLRLKDTTPSSH